MIQIGASSVFLIFFLWLMWRAWTQVDLFRPLPVHKPSKPRPVSVILPVRNEELRIAECLTHLFAQDLPQQLLEVIVVDDDSSDRTAAIAAGFRAKGAKLIKAPPLPEGWTGKAHACWIGARAAGSASADLVFIDADVSAGPELIASAMAYAQDSATGLLSVAPRLVLGSVAERLVLPCGLYALGFLQDLDAVRDGRDARANGQFIYVDRELYEAIGGHAAVRSAICEDLALARRAREHGAIVEMRDGAQLAAVRMYEGWRSMRVGLSKNVVETLGGPARTAIFAGLALLLSWAPLALGVYSLTWCARSDGHACVASAISVATVLGALTFHAAGALHFGLPIWYAALYPIGYSLCAAISLEGLFRIRRKRIVWKGRTYPGLR